MPLYQIETDAGTIEVDHDGPIDELTGPVNQWAESRRKEAFAAGEFAKAAALGPMSIAGATAGADAALTQEAQNAPPVAGAVAGVVPQPINPEAVQAERDRLAPDTWAKIVEDAKAAQAIHPAFPKPEPDSQFAGLRAPISAAETLISPNNVGLILGAALSPAILGKAVAGPLIGGGFAGLMGKELIQEGIPRAAEVISKFGLTSPQAGEAIAGAGITGLFTALGAKTGERPAVSAADILARSGTTPRTAASGRIDMADVDAAMNDLLSKPVESLLTEEPTNAIQVESPAGEVLRAPGEGKGGNVELQGVERQNQPEVTGAESAPEGGEIANEKGINEGQGQQGGLQGQVTPEQGAPEPATEPAPPSPIQDISPAIKVNGETVRGNPGETHQDILNRFIKEHPDKEADALVEFDTKENPNLFVDKAGNEISREQLQERYGVRDSQGLRQAQAKAMSEGPGAASVEEPLASYEKRRFGERFQESKDINPEIREATGNRYYEPIPNVATVKEAESIIEQRGTDESVRLVRDESFPMDHRVRSTLAQALIKKLNQSHAEAVKAGDAPAAEGFLNQAVDTAEYLSELGTKLGQGVQSFAIWSRLTPEGMLMAARRTIRKARAKAGPEGEIPKDLDPAELDELTRMAADINNTPEGFQRNEKMTDFLGRIADLKGANPADIPTALWYANILSGISTQLVNTVDTGLNVFSEAAAMAMSHPTAVPEILSGLYRGLLKGGTEAAETLRTGRGRTENKLQVSPILERTRFGTKGGVPISENTALGRVMKSAFEKKPAAILNLWKYPLRAMVASDTVFYNSFREARARVLVRAMAKKEGLSGDALFRRVDEILNRTPEAVDRAKEQAQSEGLTGSRLQRRINEIEEQGRPEELTSSTDEAAAIATYNHDPTGTLGVIAAKIGEITQNVPIARAIVPFTRIVANVANRGLDYTPWGYKRLFFGQSGGERFATKPPSGEAYRTQLAKATAGTVGMTAIAALDAAGVIQVTASGPQNPEERKQLQNSGWKPYSVKVGDTWISYQYTPLNLGLAMVGHYRDAIRYNKLDEKDAQTRLAYGMLKAGSTLFDMSFLSGLSSFMETVSGSASSTKGAGRMLARTGSSMIMPNLLKQVDRLFDPTLYEASTVQQMLIRETPIARSTMLQPALNVLGEPIRISNNRFFTRNTDDPVWKLIVEKQAFVPVPSKTRKVDNRPITEEEYRDLIKRSGAEIRSYIESNLSDLQQLPAEEVQHRVEDAARRARR